MSFRYFGEVGKFHTYQHFKSSSTENSLCSLEDTSEHTKSTMDDE